jgi:beta-alanine degradation protein BauB
MAENATTGPTERDPAKLAPDLYKVALENDRVRVLDIRMKPGDKSPEHSHPAYVMYSLSDAKAKFTNPDGTSEEVEVEAGQTVWRDAETHAVENVGTTEAHILNIELRG